MPRIIKSIVKKNASLAKLYRFYRDNKALEKSKPVKTPLGFRFIVHPTMGNQGNQMLGGTFEQEETKLFRKYADKYDIFIDVGANIGYFTCLMRFIGKKVIAIEPLRSNLDYLYENLTINGWTDCEVWPCAVGSRNGIIELYGASTGTSFIRGWGGQPTNMRSKASIVRLDNILANRFDTKKLFVKIDVEGAEYDVLRGAERLLTREPKPMLVIEIWKGQFDPKGYNPYYSKTFELLWEKGYTIRSLDEKQIVNPSDIFKGSAPGGYNFFVSIEQKASIS